MQVQDYLPLFEELLLQDYQLTLENPVYAGSLAVAIWLLTTIFYSIRISFLNSRIKRSVKAIVDAQSAQANAEQATQQAQAELAASQQQLEQEQLANQGLSERLTDLSQQLSSSILAIAANPDLGQPGLSVGEGLSTEDLWQRFNAASKAINETLVAERSHVTDLQAALAAETAKIADKETEMQAVQLRLESQSQQLARLTLALEEQKAQLAQQQSIAQQQLTQLESKYQAELVLAQAQAKAAAVSAPAVVAVKAEPVVVAEPVIAAAPSFVAPTPVEAPVVPAAPVAAAAVAAPISAPILDSLLNSAAPAPVEPAIVAEPVKAVEPAPVQIAAKAKPVKPAKPAKAAKTPATGGKFKSMFANAIQTFEKFDKKLGGGEADVVIEAVEEVQLDQAQPVAEPLVEALAVPESVAVVPEQPKPVKPAADKPSQLKGLLGKLKRK